MANETIPPRFARRDSIYLYTEAESAIANAIDIVEKAGCDVRLTEAVNLLKKAQEKVADYVDGK